RSLQNAMKHTDPADAIVLSEDDLEVFETEHNSSCATVVMIDISHSMVLYGEDRITPAKKVALALTELIMTKYPRDSIDVLLFGDDAVEVPIADIPHVKVGPYHTNTKAGLELAQRILRRRKHNNKQIFMITDGKPSALNEGGRLYTNSFGLDMKIVNRTPAATSGGERIDDLHVRFFEVGTVARDYDQVVDKRGCRNEAVPDRHSAPGSAQRCEQCCPA